jgi:hypothetical protein
MLIGFRRQFAPFVLDGSKRHTIRAPRKDGMIPTAGQTLDCYVDPRQKTMALLGRWQCVRVEGIKISQHPRDVLRVEIDGRPLLNDEAAMFLWRDGFREWVSQAIPEGHLIALTAANYFWSQRLKENRGRWIGNLIHWDFSRPVTAGRITG